jgi:hypothetical protein
MTQQDWLKEIVTYENSHRKRDYQTNQGYFAPTNHAEKVVEANI